MIKTKERFNPKARMEFRLLILLVVLFYLLAFFLRLDIYLNMAWGELTAPWLRNLLPTGFAAFFGLSIFTVRRWKEARHEFRQKELAEIKVQSLAYYDQLTHLPNRTLSMDRLSQSLHRAQRDDKLMALLFLDLDGFKNVNDSLGHSVGDKLLKAVTRRVQPYIRKSDTFGRLGGDEFIFVLTTTKTEKDISVFAKRIIQLLAEPIFIDKNAITCTASIGCAVFPWDGSDRETLLRNADAAMYSAKAKGKNQFQFYSAKLNIRATERVQIENGLRKALSQNEFVLRYQPQASMEDGRITGSEALVRWKHSVRGLISPGKFMPVAEETGLIIPLGEWVLREACKQAVRWHKAGYKDLCMAVNVSAQQFQYSDFPRTVKKIIEETGINPAKLELEITETTVVHDIESTKHTLERLADLGVNLAIDDFGTGFSSLKYLKHFSFHRLKIDQSFVRELTQDSNDEKIVLAIIALAQALGMDVMAEGVENWEQVSFLRDHQCQGFQGFVFSRPISATDFTRHLQAGTRLDVEYTFTPGDLTPEDFDEGGELFASLNEPDRSNKQ